MAPNTDRTVLGLVNDNFDLRENPAPHYVLFFISNSISVFKKTFHFNLTHGRKGPPGYMRRVFHIMAAKNLVERKTIGQNGGNSSFEPEVCHTVCTDKRS